MNKDFRVSTSFFGNKKYKRLSKALGAEGVLCLWRLWNYTALNKPDGVLSNMDPEDIELAAEWDGEPGQFIDCITDKKCNFVDLKDGVYEMHDWLEHNPYCAGAEDRSNKAKKAAEKRWNKDNDAPKANAGEPKEEASNAKKDTEQCSEHKQALLHLPSGNAPSPAPLPSPLPDPEPSPGCDARAGEADGERFENSESFSMEDLPFRFPELTDRVLRKVRESRQHAVSVIRGVENQYGEVPDVIQTAMQWFLDQEGMIQIAKLRDKCRWVLQDVLNNRSRASPASGKNGTSQHDKRFSHLAHKKTLG